MSRGTGDSQDKFTLGSGRTLQQLFQKQSPSNSPCQHFAELGGAVVTATDKPRRLQRVSVSILGQDGFTRAIGFSKTCSVCHVHPFKPHSNPTGPVEQ